MNTVRRASPTLHRHGPTLVAAVLVVALRWWTAHRREVFHLRPDEPGQLAIARFLGRGARWNMFDRSTWRPGYGALISPLTWFIDDPTTMFRGALAVNAALGGVACVLLAVLAHRMTGRSRVAAAVLAAVTVLAPGLLFTTNWVWSESLVQVVFLLVVLAALRFHDTMSAPWGVALVLGAALGFATHSRLLPLAVLPVVLVVLGARRGVLRRAQAAGLLALLGTALAAVAVCSRVVVDHVWDDPAPTNTAQGVIGRIGRVGPLAQSVLGQAWYQLVVTAGVAGIGAIALARAARDRRADRPRSTDARIVLAAVVPLVALSMVFMTDRWRPDQIVYGRYNDAVMAPVVVAGLAAVVASTRRRLLVDGLGVVVVTATIGLVLRLASGDELRAAPLVQPMVIGLVAYVGTGRLAVLAVTGAAVAVMLTGVAVVVAGAGHGRLRRVVAPALGALLLVVGYSRTQPTIDRDLNAWAGARVVEDVRGTLLPPGEPVRVRYVDGSFVVLGLQVLRASLYEFYLPENPMYVDGAVPGDRWTPYVFAPFDDAVLLATGAEMVWLDSDIAIGLWVQPAPS